MSIDILEDQCYSTRHYSREEKIARSKIRDLMAEAVDCVFTVNLGSKEKSVFSEA